VRDAINIIWRLSVAMELILAARLVLQGLGRIYSALLVGVCVFALRSSLLIISTHHAYTRSTTEWVWKVTEPLVWLLWVWIAFELFVKWARSYPGIGRFGRYLFSALIAVALLVSLIWWPYEWKALVTAGNFRIYYILNRVLIAALALFTVLVWLFFRNYPTGVAPNVIRHTRITVIYLTATALIQMAFTLSGAKLMAVSNISLVAVAAGSFAAWALLLTRKGESKESLPKLAPEEILRIERVNEELLVLMKNFPG
jgi:hypothetical protein